MTKIKLALCQMNVVDNKKENIKRAHSMIKESVSKNADFIILPEMFNCPYSNDKFIEYGEKENNSPTLNEISELAKTNKVYILAGSIPEREENKLYNTSYLFDKQGNVIAKHRKMHLFDIDVKGKVTFKESDVLTAGNKVTVAETEFGKIGIGICYDIRFPELARIMVENGALILVYPGAFNMTTGSSHWELLFRSRAIDNQAFCIGVAPALNKNASYHSYGHSIIVNPWGKVIAQASEKESLIISEIDLNEIKKIREELPLIKNKRNDIYKIILR
ncbi:MULTISPECIES: carbon-nitrogen hydrolase family protein [Methanobrevibacter]|uniref:Putative amidohydrolase n=1 Tax=Methanobrevibacter gottschalkii DSM 11977 TaxID=1122229 RepID=A0A3N5AZX1_9EURY|nr:MULTISPECIES: carbon-nitrogen hydrolase family protein [Methanobrevibacter]OEC99589.1 carbon-nitrogen hydrolase [Methanobrevibacter sp. A27]RPF50513.1 putative amidohydrolase [Methanobrevibacter gottschalkii DSM 11977]